MSALDENGQRLNAARAVIADLAHHTDAEIALACAVVAELSSDSDERDEAEALQEQLGEVTV